MPDSLPELERRRADIARQIAQLSDLRAGSITTTFGCCGKPDCRCHRPNQPAHGPNWRLTYKVRGKTVTESLPTPAAIRKAESEVAEFRKFQQLRQQFVEVNSRICRSRPLGDQTTPQEKKRPQRSGRKSAAK